MGVMTASKPAPAPGPAGRRKPDPEVLLKLEVPIVVRLAEREMAVQDVLRFVPGSLIELPKNAEDELDLLVNNKPIGQGTAVKVGENFGIRVTFIGDLRARLAALAGQHPAPNPAAAIDSPPDPDAEAARMLSGQV
ncbi:MAG: hypothetical protein EA378_11650 [Phycisphaerales bacterium]|nr:MAG: hypothetical protein EA378_11650 [Phycisphaerales bacterium]